MAVEAFAFTHQLGSIIYLNSGIGQQQGSGFFLDGSSGQGSSSAHASLGTGVLLVLLDLVAHDFKMACSLGTERGELLEGSIRVDFSHGQLL